MTPLSVLDLVPVRVGDTPADALRNTLDLARHCDGWGYRRYWMAEHHNMTGIASAATAVVIGHVAGGTKTIRVGAGGVMLPNHSPLVIAEQFGTLETLYPGRIDLGLGRAPGSDQNTMRALRRDAMSANDFPRDVLELQGYLTGQSRIPGVEAIPGTGTNVPLYILGSSLFGAQLAAALGLPYAFASHFAPDALHEAVALYRREFKASDQLAEPYVIAGANVIAAEDGAYATEQFETMRRSRVRWMISRGPSTPDYSDAQIDAFLATPEGRSIANMTKYSAVGTPADIRSYLVNFAATAQADELIVAHQSPLVADRLRSVELTANAMQGAAVPPS